MAKKTGGKRPRQRTKPLPCAPDEKASERPRYAEPWKWLIPLALAALCFAAWSPTISYPFHFDDRHAIRDNEPIREIENLAQFLNPSRDLFARGVLNAGYTLNYAIARKNASGVPSPKTFHAVNVLIHTLNAILLFVLVLP